MTISVDALLHCMPTLSRPCAEQLMPHLVAAMDEAELTTPVRQAAFLAQIGHESRDLRFFSEIWGPTPAQREYEPPSALAFRLGNSHAGDGFRYRGRGAIQLTGRENYRRYGALLGLPLEERPDVAERDDVAFRIAAAYWTTHGLNALADAGQFPRITRAINGGLNGEADREARYQRALAALAMAEGAELRREVERRAAPMKKA